MLIEEITEYTAEPQCGESAVAVTLLRSAAVSCSQLTEPNRSAASATGNTTFIHTQVNLPLLRFICSPNKANSGAQLDMSTTECLCFIIVSLVPKR